MEKTIDEWKDVTPKKIFKTYFAHMSTALLVMGVDLEEYTYIKNGHRTAVEIAKAAQASPQGMEILLNGLVALNFLTKSSEVYQLTTLAEKFPMSSRPVSPTVLLSRVNQDEGG